VTLEPAGSDQERQQDERDCDTPSGHPALREDDEAPRKEDVLPWGSVLVRMRMTSVGRVVWSVDERPARG